MSRKTFRSSGREAFPPSNAPLNLHRIVIDERALGAELVRLAEAGKVNRQTRRLIAAMRRKGNR